MEENAVWVRRAAAVMIEARGRGPGVSGPGLAREAISRVLEEMKARGYRGARYLVGPNNLRARAAYRRSISAWPGKPNAYGEHWLCYEKEL